jgi:hypothetical protein
MVIAMGYVCRRRILYSLTQGLLTWYGLFSLLCTQCSVLFYGIVLLCVTVFLLCIVLFNFLVLYCVLLVMYVLLPYLRFYCSFSSVVRQIPGYNSQSRGTARTSQISFKIFWLLWNFLFFIVMYVPFSVFCVLFVCKCVLYYCHRVSTQLQLIYISYHILHMWSRRTWY